ncbi:DeoR family transcriptional regulator [Aquisalimonas sp.]|uniref:DeoR/GlpR family DNA-binding transcription regulator n=1 Tax=Aquisalimonas sp. TaxID=1872621 RepID=UPI0025C41408|nr:DeoR family transcriptional regulator [Aquisalimonas sp.]
MNFRQNELVQKVREQGFVSIEDLAQVFDVTPQTIRRDVNVLAGQGLLRRYHGGVAPASGAENVAYIARCGLLLPEKQRIAALLAEHIPNRSSLFINLGTTTEAVAAALTGHTGLRVITNNLNVATMLCNDPSSEVVVAPGVVRGRDRGVTGEATIDFIRQFKVDYGVIGISGIDPDGTLRDFDYREVRVSQAILAHSRRVFLAADHSKFSRDALVELGHLSQIDTLFTDAPPPPAMLPVLEEAGVTVRVAGPASTRSEPAASSGG